MNKSIRKEANAAVGKRKVYASELEGHARDLLLSAAAVSLSNPAAAEGIATAAAAVLRAAQMVECAGGVIA